jgi:hypothetical protein
MSKDKDEPNFEHPSQEDNFMDILLGDQKDDLIEDCECKHQGSTGVGMDYHPEVMREELDELKLDIRIVFVYFIVTERRAVLSIARKTFFVAQRGG